MTLRDAIDNYTRHSTQASQNVRALAFAGIGIVWILSNQKIDGVQPDLLKCLVWFGFALVLDFLHYSLASLIWGVFVNRVEKRPKGAWKDVHAQDWFNYPTLVLFWLKQAAIMPAYALLLSALFARFPGGSSVSQGGQAPLPQQSRQNTIGPAPVRDGGALTR